MTDRELLEKAARAAGMTRHRYCEPWGCMAEYTPQDGFYGPSWDPLADDGDALRLAVKRNAYVQVLEGAKESRCLIGESWVAVGWDECGGDPYAATRRAIVRAAASMGGVQRDPR